MATETVPPATESTTSASMIALTPNLGVKNVPASIKFYTEKLGFKLTQTHPADTSEEEPIWASLSHGEKVRIMIGLQESIEKEYKDTKTEHLGGGMTLYYTVDDVDVYYKQVKENGGVILLKEPEVMFYGMKEFSIKDVDGYVLTFGSMAKKEEEKTNLENDKTEKKE